MKAIRGLMWLGAVAAAWGCASGGDRECEVVGVGKGACCDLLGSDGQTRPGACINGICTDGVESDPYNEACGSGGGSSRRDFGGGLLLDASAAGGAGGGGAGGAGGVGGGAGGA
ncbi:MAG: hypothetical protein KC613_19025, partial [Myxococcales bacterium]|nr:hypothetical protein [Myxococcales bacterium]